MKIQFNIICLLVLLIASGCHRRFDKQKWKNPPQGKTKYRARMLPGLLKKHKLTGMSFSQITNLLGPPEDTSLFGPSNIEYKLAPHFLDHDWLILDLNTNKAVTRHWVSHD